MTQRNLILNMLNNALNQAGLTKQDVVITARSVGEVEFLLCIIQDLIEQREWWYTKVNDTCYRILDNATLTVIAKEATVKEIKQNLIRG